MPRVSVIIPAFNAERHLDQALASVESQTYDDWEIVVADDVSTDRTTEIAQARGSHLTLVRNETNSGPATARNIAIAAASGELLALLDADDYWDKRYLEQQVALYDESERSIGRVGIVTCDARVLGPDGLLSQTYLERIGFPNDLSLARFLVSNPIFGSALMPRAVVDEAGGFAPELFGTEDYDLWVRIVELGYRVVVSRQALAVYRLGSMSVSANSARMAHNEALVFQRALDRDNLGPHEQRIARRELRRRHAVEQVLGPDGIDAKKAVRALPLLVRVIAENPHAWRSIPRIIASRGKPLFTRFG